MPDQPPSPPPNPPGPSTRWRDRLNDWWHPDSYSGLNRRQVVWLLFVREPRFRWTMLAILFVLFSVAAVAGFAGRTWLRHHREQQYVAQAKSFLAAGDLQPAIFRSQMVLRQDPDNLPATHIMAEIASHTGDQSAIHWRQRELELNPTITNQLLLAATALRMESYPFPVAAKTLQDVAPADRNTAGYQSLAGMLAVRLNQRQNAEEHFAEAIHDDPAGSGNQVSLAVLQLQSTNAAMHQAARATLEKMAQIPHTEMAALRPLVAESFDRKEFARAEQLSGRVVTNEQATLNDWLFHLTILHAGHSPGFPAFLARAEARARTNAYAANEIGTWMNASGYAQSALIWLTNLPPEVARQSLLAVTISDSYATLGQWDVQERYLKSMVWPNLEPIRLALLARAAEKVNDPKESVYWQQALDGATSSPDMLKKLAGLTASWGWATQTETILWLVVDTYPEQTWPMPALARICNTKGDTGRLQHLAKIRYRLSPADPVAQNNFAVLSLLMNLDLPQAEDVAAAVCSADPTNAAYATTYALSLLKQHRNAEALATLQKLTPEQLQVPEIAAYYGIVLAAVGDTASAQTWLNLSAHARLLPEEQAMVARAKNADGTPVF